MCACCHEPLSLEAKNRGNMNDDLTMRNDTNMDGWWMNESSDSFVVRGYDDEEVWSGTCAEFGALLHMLRTLGDESLYRIDDTYMDAEKTSLVEAWIRNEILIQVWSKKDSV